jgi:hypothetical protein
MKFGKELWLNLFEEYISPNLFAVCNGGQRMEPIYLSVDGNYDGKKVNLNYFMGVDGICHP